MKKYDIFISYRRLGGEYTAKIIKDRLEDMGYKVFFDVESLRSGDFNTKLYSVIDECADFLLILSPGSLERTENENDWLRLEIMRALERQANIIPVMLREFEFPAQLPPEIEPIRFKNGIEANSEFFDAFIQRLTKSFLKSKPKVKNRIPLMFRRTWPVLLSLIVIAGLIVGGMVLFSESSKSSPASEEQKNLTEETEAYPVTQEQKNLTEEVLMYMQNNLMAANTMVEEMNVAYEACDNYLKLDDTLSYQAALSAISTAYSNIDDIIIAGKAMDGELSETLNDSRFVKADLQSLNSNIDITKTEFARNLVRMQIMLQPNSGIDDVTILEWMDMEKQMVDLFAREMVYATNMLLLPVSDSYLYDFKQSLLPTLTHLPYSEIAWQTSEDELKRFMNTVYNQYEEVTSKITELVGNKNISEKNAEAELIEFAESIGFSKADAEKNVADLLAKSDDFTQLRYKLSELKLQLESERKAASEKFAPLSTDEPGIIWSKMLRFLKISLYDDAVKCAQAYQQKVRESDPNADTYMPIVINFIQQIGNTGIDYGLIVLGYEPGKPEHALYKIGDIIVAMNGNPCRTVEEMESYHKDSGNVATILRADDQGKLTLGDYNVPTGQCKVLYYNLSEEE